jgi:thioredoxin-like negative regulator of GroEL
MGALPALTAAGFPREVLESEQPVVVLFGAAYCPACRLMEGTLSELAALHPGVRVRYVDVVSEDGALIRERHLWPAGVSFSVSVIPTTIIFSVGEPQETVYGAVPLAAIEDALSQWVQPSPRRESAPLTEREQRALEEMRARVDSTRTLRPGALEDV